MFVKLVYKSREEDRTMRITREKLQNKGCYRSQVNVNDKYVIAIAYNYLADTMTKDRVEQVRNKLADAIETIILNQFAFKLAYTGEEEIKKWVEANVEPELRENVIAWIKEKNDFEIV